MQNTERKKSKSSVWYIDKRVKIDFTINIKKTNYQF